MTSKSDIKQMSDKGIAMHVRACFDDLLRAIDAAEQVGLEVGIDFDQMHAQLIEAVISYASSPFTITRVL